MATGSGCKEADKCGTEKVLRAVIAQRKASKIKKQGNESFIKKDYDQAIGKYKEAILQYGFECPKEKAVCYSNLSQCYINRKDFVLAEMNSKKTLELDHENEKAKMRLKKAQEEMMVT
jgi:tetratricopeptide (TPR) repeat protein